MNGSEAGGPAGGVPGIPAQAAGSTACALCGTTTSLGASRVHGAWTWASGRSTWRCDACARATLRDMEAGVESA